MALHNLTATRVREPGFSPSECLELAKRIENQDVGIVIASFECADCGNFSCESPDVAFRERNLIVAALRAYAE